MGQIIEFMIEAEYNNYREMHNTARAMTTQLGKTLFGALWSRKQKTCKKSMAAGRTPRTAHEEERCVTR